MAGLNVREFIAQQHWIEAVTYRDKAPHEYTIRAKANGPDEDFVEMAKIIRRYGFKGEFWKKERIYFYIDGYFYWTMDDKVEYTTLINRCKAEDYTVYMTVRQK